MIHICPCLPNGSIVFTRVRDVRRPNNELVVCFARLDLDGRGRNEDELRDGDEEERENCEDIHFRVHGWLLACIEDEIRKRDQHEFEAGKRASVGLRESRGKEMNQNQLLYKPNVFVWFLRSKLLKVIGSEF